jgi:ankyrin repeat protein
MEKQNITSQNTTNAFKQQSLSNLYIACQENDYMLALTLPETLEFNRINRLESNGSTALHVAIALGRDEIMSLLLNVYGVMRDQKDQNNRTAYELACNDKIRQLFHRPKNNNRFDINDNNISANLFSINIFHLLQIASDDMKMFMK